MAKRIVLNGSTMSIQDVVDVARGITGANGDHTYPHVELHEDLRKKLEESELGLKAFIGDGAIVYGVNTGCGIKKGTIIPDEEIDEYQAFYIPAHCVGFGDVFEEEVVRGAMVQRVISFIQGNSGVRLVLIEKILELLNKGVIPCVPQQGSVGSSGDLCPLAHMSAAMLGLSGQKACYQGKVMSSSDALAAAGIEPISLKAKEAMGLTNGATFMLSLTVLAYHDMMNLVKMSNIATALSLEAIRGEKNAFDPRIHAVRNHPGQIAIAKHIRSLIDGSERMSSETQAKTLNGVEVDIIPEGKNAGKPMPRVQDRYSFRCYPQVAGSTWDNLAHVKKILENEINASTDNPLVFEIDGQPGVYEAISGGNFHGEYIAHANDLLKIVIQAIANVSNSRFYSLTIKTASYGLPADLAGSTNRGLNTGYMILQYAAAAAVSENKVLSHPASVDSIPTSAGQEDYVSMGTHGARFLRQVVANTEFVIACELIGACQGITLTQEELGNPKLGVGTARALAKVREHIIEMDDDRFIHADTEKMLAVMRSGEFLSVFQDLDM